VSERGEERFSERRRLPTTFKRTFACEEKQQRHKKTTAEITTTTTTTHDEPPYCTKIIT
jgi:hypothetical protein